jgi:hypothetical protein
MKTDALRVSPSAAAFYPETKFKNKGVLLFDQIK